MKKISLLITIVALAVSCNETLKEESQAALFARLDTEIKQNSKAYTVAYIIMSILIEFLMVMLGIH
jgi:hypothetical protein